MKSNLFFVVMFNVFTFTVSVLTTFTAYTSLPNNLITWLLVFWIWGIALWHFFTSLKSHKWGLQLYNIFLPRKMVVELTDFEGERYFTIVSPCDAQNTEYAWEGFVYPETKTTSLLLNSDGSVAEPRYIKYWQPVKKNLRTEHFLRNSETIIKLQSTI